MKRRNTIRFPKDSTDFKKKVLEWIDRENEIFFFLDSADYPSGGFVNKTYECLVAVGEIERVSIKGSSFESLKKFQTIHSDWLFGYFSYDLKNEIEDLVSVHEDELQFPEIYFFRPKIVIEIYKDFSDISCFEDDEFIDNIFNSIHSVPENNNIKNTELLTAIPIKNRMKKEEYISSVKEIQKHIKQGDIYEVNFCQEFYYEHAKINPAELYKKLVDFSKSPFSSFCRMRDHYIISASPERFLKKEGRKIISQPIKGTIRRGKDQEEDTYLKDQLLQDPKEVSENVMIVDIVRNDLSHFAKRGSVKVDELFGIYSFGRVHQMISTVSAILDDETDMIDAIEQAFPMGSMTGAPKVKAMQLIEKFETRKRGLYSGALGYFKPDGDFDFNVVIRSILYNQLNQYLSFHTGSAITYGSDAEKEYLECLLKAHAMVDALNL